VNRSRSTCIVHFGDSEECSGGVQNGYFLFGQDRRDYSGFSERAANLTLTVRQVESLGVHSCTHVEHGEYQTLEECAGLVKRSFQAFIVLHIEFPVLCNVFSYRIEKDHLHE
jgi:hypothetical protein